MKNLFANLFKKTSTTMIVSVLLAVVGWYLVVYSISPGDDIELKNVKVEITPPIGSGLNVVGAMDVRATVKVEGMRYNIGNLEADEVVLRADLTKLYKPGEYELDINAVQPKDGRYEVVSFYPNTVTVTLDKQISKELPVNYSSEGLTVPEEEYILGQYTLSPERVLITGPETEIVDITRAVVMQTFDEPLTESQKSTINITLYDRFDNEVLSKSRDESSNITVNFDVAEVTIPIMEIVEVPLTLSFINAPDDFPIEDLDYTMSNETITIAATEDIISRYYEVPLGHIDIYQLDLLENNSITFDVELPQNVVNHDHMENVVVNFNVDNLTSKTLNIRNIALLNLSPDYEVKIMTSVINNVNFIGDKEAIDKLSADSVVAEIDFALQEMTTGQYQIPVRIQVPGDDLLWAVGNYQVVVNVQEK